MNIYTKSSRNAMESMEDSMHYMSIMADSLGSEKLFIAAVADGVGSLSRSSEVSSLAIALLFQELVGLALSDEFAQAQGERKNALIATWADVVLDRVSSRIRNAFGQLSVGTTITFAIESSGSLIVCGCGDSPAILVRGGTAELFIPLDRAQGTQNAIIQYIGSPLVHLKGNIASLSPLPGDRMLIGTDGAFGRLTLEEIASMSTGNGEAVVDSIIASASKTTGDNQSLILLDFTAAGNSAKGRWYLPWTKR